MSKKCFPNNGGATSTPNARDLASRAQSPDRAPMETTTPKICTMSTGKKRSRKFLKVLAATGLALFMGIGTLCGVIIAPINSAQANTSREDVCNTSSTSSTGLITPQEDDPVICTTDYGLEIKYGKALSGNLAGFPYIVTNDGSLDYYWVVIGVSSLNKTYPVGGLYQSISGFEMISPAGIAIFKNNSTPILLKNNGKNTILNKLHYSSEIPDFCVLCLSNEVVSSAAYNFYKGTSSTYNGAEEISVAMEGYYTDGSFGLSALSAQIEQVDLITYSYTTSWNTYNYAQHVFPLASNDESSFYWGDYLTSDEIKLSQAQWIRGNDGATTTYTVVRWNTYTKFYANHYIDSSGTAQYGSITNSYGYRPAFCLSLL